MQQCMHIRIEKKGKKALNSISEKTLPEYLPVCPAKSRPLNLLLTIEIILFIIDKIYIISECKGKGTK
jgi:hypothetical protein